MQGEAEGNGDGANGATLAAVSRRLASAVASRLRPPGGGAARIRALGADSVGPVSPASAAAFRVLFGLLGLVAVVRFAALGWIGELYVEPEHHFTYPGFWWVRPWPGWGMDALFSLVALGSVGIALGLWYRASSALFFLAFTYVELIDKTTYLNHYYWVSLTALLMIFLPLHRRWSLDALRRPGLRADVIPRGVVWLLRAQVGVVYVFAGVAKLNADWLFEAMPLRIWLHQSGGIALVGPLLAEPWVAYAMSWAGAAFDLTIVGWLLWRRSRPFAYAVLTAFHLVTWVLFPIGMFPWLMMAGALVFFSPGWPRNAGGAVAGMLRPGAAPPTPVAPAPAAFARPSLLVSAAVVLLVLAHLAVPLRHLAYPGNVRWNEDGYRFSWRVLLTEKAGFVRFRVSDPVGGGTWLVEPEAYLTPQQAERMAVQPDMILQTAHIVAEDFRDRGRGAVEVRADAFAAFNGEPYRRLIDADVDLAAVRPTVWSKWWVEPRAPAD